MTNLPSPVEETSLGLQLILDRLLRNTIQNQAAQPGNVSTAAVARPLDKLEINAIRYMAGYIAVKLLKKYRKKAKHPRLQQKRRLFVAVLKHMRADNQPGLTGSTLVDYTEQWSRLVDRGGLYHINDKVFELIESLEKKVRLHMNTSAISTAYTAGCDLRSLIKGEVFADREILDV